MIKNLQPLANCYRSIYLKFANYVANQCNIKLIEDVDSKELCIKQLDDNRPAKFPDTYKPISVVTVTLQTIKLKLVYSLDPLTDITNKIAFNLKNNLNFNCSLESIYDITSFRRTDAVNPELMSLQLPYTLVEIDLTGKGIFHLTLTIDIF